MNREYEKNLHTKVTAFKLWAKQNYPQMTEKADNGEWCFCLEFDDMRSYSIAVINEVSADEATEQMVDDLLYVIARDNECSTVIEELEKCDHWFSLLCRCCINTEYINAKWQFAEHLHSYKGKDNLQEMVYDFLSAEDEYTERLALKALADIYPECAEQYAIEFWERNKYEYDEYQKIMVLHVLYQIHSAKLPYYLELAKMSDYKYLKENAEAIQDKLKDQDSQFQVADSYL